VQTNLVFLGFARRILFSDVSKSYENVSWKQTLGLSTQTDARRAGLFCAPDSMRLFIVPWVKPVISDCEPGKAPQLENTAEKWAHYRSDKKIELYFPANVKTLKRAGRLEEIEYSSDKFDTETDSGKWNLYLHTYREPPDLFVNCPIKPYIWGVADSKGRKLVSYRGLVL
jgi:hypothetical protein